MRIVGSVREHARAHVIDDRLDHVLTLGHLDAGEEAAPGQLLPW